jgi:Asp/Glu/hydantoin racemase
MVSIMASPRIALIHATPVAVDPIKAAFAALWPEAEAVSILDEALSGDRAQTTELTPALSQRIFSLATYGQSVGAAAVLFTCSAFGPAIEAAANALPIPVLKPNEAMFEDALALGDRIGMVVTFAPARLTMEDEFAADAARQGRHARLAVDVCVEAMAALRSGDPATHNQRVAERCAAMTDVDAIMLAHFSTARALAASTSRTGVPILSSPEAAVRKLRRLITDKNR